MALYNPPTQVSEIFNMAFYTAPDEEMLTLGDANSYYIKKSGFDTVLASLVFEGQLTLQQNSMSYAEMTFLSGVNPKVIISPTTGITTNFLNTIPAATIAHLSDVILPIQAQFTAFNSRLLTSGSSTNNTSLTGITTVNGTLNVADGVIVGKSSTPSPPNIYSIVYDLTRPVEPNIPSLDQQYQWYKIATFTLNGTVNQSLDTVRLTTYMHNTSGVTNVRFTETYRGYLLCKTNSFSKPIVERDFTNATPFIPTSGQICVRTNIVDTNVMPSMAVNGTSYEIWVKNSYTIEHKVGSTWYPTDIENYGGVYNTRWNTDNTSAIIALPPLVSPTATGRLDVGDLYCANLFSAGFNIPIQAGVFLINGYFQDGQVIPFPVYYSVPKTINLYNQDQTDPNIAVTKQNSSLAAAGRYIIFAMASQDDYYIVHGGYGLICYSSQDYLGQIILNFKNTSNYPICVSPNAGVMNVTQSIRVYYKDVALVRPN